MTARKVLAREAADLLGAWGDKALRPLCTPSTEALDLDLEATCDEMLRVIADAPWGDISTFPKPLLQLAWARVLFVTGLATLRPGDVILELPEAPSQEMLLQVLVGGILAGQRLPSEWRRRPPRAAAEPPQAGSLRVN